MSDLKVLGQSAHESFKTLSFMSFDRGFHMLRVSTRGDTRTTGGFNCLLRGPQRRSSCSKSSGLPEPTKIRCFKGDWVSCSLRPRKSLGLGRQVWKQRTVEQRNLQSRRNFHLMLEVSYLSRPTGTEEKDSPPEGRAEIQRAVDTCFFQIETFTFDHLEKS